MSTVQELDELWAGDSNLREELEQSHEPRGTEWLFDLFDGPRPQRGQLLLDVGARDARHAIRPERYHGLRGGLVCRIHQLLGKLCPTVYVWSKTSSA